MDLLGSETGERLDYLDYRGFQRRAVIASRKVTAVADRLETRNQTAGRGIAGSTRVAALQPGSHSKLNCVVLGYNTSKLRCRRTLRTAGARALCLGVLGSSDPYLVDLTFRKRGYDGLPNAQTVTDHVWRTVLPPVPIISETTFRAEMRVGAGVGSRGRRSYASQPVELDLSRIGLAADGARAGDRSRPQRGHVHASDRSRS